MNNLETISFVTDNEVPSGAREVSPYGALQLPKDRAGAESAVRIHLRALEALISAEPEVTRLIVEGCEALLDRVAPLEPSRCHGVGEAMEITGLSRARIKQLTNDGYGRFVSGRWMFSREELLDYVAQRSSRCNRSSGEQ